MALLFRLSPVFYTCVWRFSGLFFVRDGPSSSASLPWTTIITSGLARPENDCLCSGGSNSLGVVPGPMGKLGRSLPVPQQGPSPGFRAIPPPGSLCLAQPGNYLERLSLRRQPFLPSGDSASYLIRAKAFFIAAMVAAQASSLFKSLRTLLKGSARTGPSNPRRSRPRCQSPPRRRR